MDAIIDAPETGKPTGELTLRLERRLAAPPELVFDAWVQPAHLRRWSAPHGFEIPECDGDARPGGSWHATMLSPDGRRLRLRGTYREVVRPKWLVFTHAWLGDDGTPGPETVVTVVFEAVEGGTLMRFTQTGFDAAPDRDGHGDGWSQCFERLAALLANPD
ncbi:MAG TPA: SRPBCC domain-containing protein [Amaricoccus sp.]|nr:SRPBCC domain-containing protein [Amaricoccus sp.]